MPIRFFAWTSAAVQVKCATAVQHAVQAVRSAVLKTSGTWEDSVALLGIQIAMDNAVQAPANGSIFATGISGNVFRILMYVWPMVGLIKHARHIVIVEKVWWSAIMVAASRYPNHHLNA